VRGIFVREGEGGEGCTVWRVYRLPDIPANAGLLFGDKVKRTLCNEEFHNLYSAGIIRMRWAGYVVRMRQIRNRHRILTPHGSLRRRLEDNIKIRCEDVDLIRIAFVASPVLRNSRRIYSDCSGIESVYLKHTAVLES
jgi:hypothetical protein